MPAPSAAARPHDFPKPAPDAAAHSARLAAHIRTLISTSDGRQEGVGEPSISFADFMRAALYAPGLGYYTAGATKLGIGGDFVTAPELSSLFGAALADAFAPLAASSVLELGAGSGRLARDFLAASANATPYAILEVSADLRERQNALLTDYAVRWLDQLPGRIEGLVIANEVLDAVPCEIVRFHAGQYEQARVVARGEHFDWAWRQLADGALLAAAQSRVLSIEGYTSELNLEAEALVATLAERLADGVLCLIDYGFPRREYFLPDRSGGTLACHYQQRVHFDPFALLGLQDITAHVDFTAMAEAAVDAGASVVCYASQAQFLLHAGLLRRFEAQEFTTEAARARTLGPIQKLLSPAEMGELFKVLVIGKGAALDSLAGMAAIDQSFRL